MTSAVSPRAHMDFELPPSLEAVAPPEERGRGRDDVRLMEARRSSGLIAHHKFQALPDLDANANAVAIQTVKLENEGWERDYDVSEPSEPTFTEPA